MPIAGLLVYLPQMIAAGKSLWGMVQDIRTAAKQSGEWSDEHEIAFQAQLQAEASAPEQQPDK